MVPMGHDEVRPLCGKQSPFSQQILDFLDNGSERLTCSHRSPSSRVAFHTAFRLALDRVRVVRIQTAGYPVNGLRRSATTSHSISHRSPSSRVAFHTAFRLALDRVRVVRIQTAGYPVNGLRRSATTSHSTSNQWRNRIPESRYRPAVFSKCRTPVASLSTQSD